VQRGDENRVRTIFLLAGRTLTLPVFVATLVSTWYGGILGVGEYSYRFGISNWVVFGVPYYIFALVFALFLAKKVRATNLFTIPDRLEQAYDKRTAIAGAILTFFSRYSGCVRSYAGDSCSTNFWNRSHPLHNHYYFSHRCVSL